MKKRRMRERGFGIKWKVEIKKERMEIYGYTRVVEKKQDKKRKRERKRMDKRKEMNRK